MAILSLKNANEFQLFGVSAVFELFPSPILDNLKTTELDINEPDDLLQASLQFGFKPLYISKDKHIEAIVDGKKGQVKNYDFLKWQISNLKSSQLYEPINKTETEFEFLANEKEELLRDPDYAPSEWLCDAYKAHRQNGIGLIDRIRSENAEQFETTVADSFLDGDIGLLSCLEAEIDTDLCILERYQRWEYPLAIVSLGRFMPFKSIGSSDLEMYDFRIWKCYVRNNDEDPF